MNNICISQRSIGIIDQDTGGVKIEHILSYDLIASPGFFESDEERIERLKKERLNKINIALDETTDKNKE